MSRLRPSYESSQNPDYGWLLVTAAWRETYPKVYTFVKACPLMPDLYAPAELSGSRWPIWGNFNNNYLIARCRTELLDNPQRGSTLG